MFLQFSIKTISFLTLPHTYGTGLDNTEGLVGDFFLSVGSQELSTVYHSLQSTLWLKKTPSLAQGQVSRKLPSVRQRLQPHADVCEGSVFLLNWLWRVLSPLHCSHTACPFETRSCDAQLASDQVKNHYHVTLVAVSNPWWGAAAVLLNNVCHWFRKSFSKTQKVMKKIHLLVNTCTVSLFNIIYNGDI